MAHQIERNQDATVYIGNLDDRCSEALVWELMLQAGPVVNVHLPKDRVTQTHQGYGFCEFMSEEDADYAIKIMNHIKMYGKAIRVNKATSDKKNLDVGASLFIGNLDPDVDEQMLYDTFSAFGVIVQTPKVATDPETGNSKGYGFVSYDNFDSSDAAIDAMNGQYLMNKPITVSYAFKKDGKGERHGSAAERLLAAQARKNQTLPNRLFANPPGAPGGSISMGINGRPAMGMSGGIPAQAIPLGIRPPPVPPMPMPMSNGITGAQQAYNGGIPSGYRPPIPPSVSPMSGGLPGGYGRTPLPSQQQLMQQGTTGVPQGMSGIARPSGPPPPPPFGAVPSSQQPVRPPYSSAPPPPPTAQGVPFATQYGQFRGPAPPAPGR